MPNPLGNPISAALDTTGHPIQRRLDAMLRLIDRVHGTGAITLPRIPVKQETQPQKHNSTFARTNRIPSSPLFISVNDKGPCPELSLAHETGHFLERFGIPGHCNGNRSYATDSTLTDWLAAVRASHAYGELGQLQGVLSVQRPDASGTMQTYPVDQARVGYLRQESELWARSYAQYIALRTGDQTLFRQLDLFRDPWRDPVYNATQWQDADFAPIAAAMDQLFHSIGWCS
jgi:hypothetical protein